MDIFSSIQLEFNHSDMETLPHISVYITSEDNSNGIILYTWNDGQVKKSQIHKNWINNHVWMTLFPEKINHLKLTTNCSDRTSYKQFGLKLQKSIDLLNCTEKCLPKSLRSIVPLTDQNAITLCKTKEDEKCAFSAAYDILKFSETKKTCSIYQYSGDFEYWTIEEDGRAKDKRTFSFGWWFPTPAMVKIHEEYLIYDTITLTSAIASTLGMFIGFSFSGVVGFAFRFFKPKVE